MTESTQGMEIQNFSAANDRFLFRYREQFFKILSIQMRKMEIFEKNLKTFGIIKQTKNGNHLKIDLMLSKQSIK